MRVLMATGVKEIDESIVLPESVEPEVLQSILYMGIYDVYKTGSVSMERLPEMLSARKDIKDFGLSTLPVPRKAGGTEVVPKGSDVAVKGIRQSVVRLLSALHKRLFRRAEKKS